MAAILSKPCPLLRYRLTNQVTNSNCVSSVIPQSTVHVVHVSSPQGTVTPHAEREPTLISAHMSATKNKVNVTYICVSFKQIPHDFEVL